MDTVAHAVTTCTNCIPDLNLLVSPQVVQIWEEQVRVPKLCALIRSCELCSFARAGHKGSCHWFSRQTIGTDACVYIHMQVKSYGPTISGALFGAGAVCQTFRWSCVKHMQRRCCTCSVDAGLFCSPLSRHALDMQGGGSGRTHAPQQRRRCPLCNIYLASR